MIGFNNPIIELKKWWHGYSGDKCDWWLFYNRMHKLKRPKEEAILKELPKKEKPIKPCVTKEIIAERKKKAKTNHKMENEAKYKPSYYEIKVTYPTIEEREIFNRAYLRQIKEQEHNVFVADTPTEYVEAMKVLNKLQGEYKTFLTFNQGLGQQQFD